MSMSVLLFAFVDSEVVSFGMKWKHIIYYFLLFDYDSLRSHTCLYKIEVFSFSIYTHVQWKKFSSTISAKVKRKTQTYWKQSFWPLQFMSNGFCILKQMFAVARLRDLTMHIMVTLTLKWNSRLSLIHMDWIVTFVQCWRSQLSAVDAAKEDIASRQMRFCAVRKV